MSDPRPAAPQTAALLLDEAVTRRVARCVLPDPHGRDSAASEPTVRDLLDLVDAYRRTVSTEPPRPERLPGRSERSGRGQVGR